MKKENGFAFIVSERSLSDSDVRRYWEETNGDGMEMLVYKFSYSPPYEKNSMFLKKFQYRSAYRPFRDDTKKRKIAAINMTEWIGHEQEEKLEIFTKFLHDYRSFFDFEYVFVVENIDRQGARDMFCSVSKYLGRGRIFEDKKREEKEAI